MCFMSIDYLFLFNIKSNLSDPQFQIWMSDSQQYLLNILLNNNEKDNVAFRSVKVLKSLFFFNDKLACYFLEKLKFGNYQKQQHF